MMEHQCHAIGCTTKTRPELFMCRRHWFMVPHLMRADILQHYRKGQEIDKQPSADYMEATQVAREAVAAKEGR